MNRQLIILLLRMLFMDQVEQIAVVLTNSHSEPKEA